MKHTKRLCVHLKEWGNETEHPEIEPLKVYACALAKLRAESLQVLEEVLGVYVKRGKETWIKYAERTENENASVRQTIKTKLYAYDKLMAIVK